MPVANILDDTWRQVITECQENQKGLLFGGEVSAAVKLLSKGCRKEIQMLCGGVQKNAQGSLHACIMRHIKEESMKSARNDLPRISTECRHAEFGSPLIESSEMKILNTAPSELATKIENERLAINHARLQMDEVAQEGIDLLNDLKGGKGNRSIDGHKRTNGLTRARLKLVREAAEIESVHMFPEAVKSSFPTDESRDSNRLFPEIVQSDLRNTTNTR